MSKSIFWRRRGRRDVVRLARMGLTSTWNIVQAKSASITDPKSLNLENHLVLKACEVRAVRSVRVDVRRQVD